MKNLQKMGGVSALITAATFVFGMAIFALVLMPAGYGSLDIGAAANVAFLVENQSLLYWWYLVIYVVFGIFLVVLSLALHERLRVASPGLAQTATAFGLIWAGLVIASGMVANIGAAQVAELARQNMVQAESVWLALRFVVDGLGGGNEIVGGLWVLLVSFAGLQARALPKALNYFGLIVGLAGVITTVPALSGLGAVFGLGSIVWFVGLGIILLRRS